MTRAPLLLLLLTHAAAAQPAELGRGKALYLGLGLASTLGPGPGEGPALRMGYRFELPALAIDVGLGATLDFATVGGAKEKPRPQSVAGVLPRGVALWFMLPGSSTPYVGGGVSLYGLQQSDAAESFSRLGLGAEALVGFEWLRATPSARLFVELCATLPVFTVPTQAGAVYTPTFFLLFAGGYDIQR